MVLKYENQPILLCCSFSCQNTAVLLLLQLFSPTLVIKVQERPDAVVCVSPHQIWARFRGSYHLSTSADARPKKALKACIGTSERREPLTTASLPVQHVDHVSPQSPMWRPLNWTAPSPRRCEMFAASVGCLLWSNCSARYCNKIKAGEVNWGILRSCLGVQAICCWFGPWYPSLRPGQSVLFLIKR